MKKNRNLKKSTFVKGTFIMTLGIIITKLFGILYVIPFHAIIGEEGGALYGYAYTIYLFFMSISTAGIPLAISNVVSEYQTLGYTNVKKRVFTLGKKISLILSIICFLIIILCAPLIASLIIGGVSGGNSISDISFVIRVIGCAILIVPVLSVYRGYFEGHRFMDVVSISQVLEQLVRVLIIIFGSLMAVKVFKLDLKSTVGVALFGATVGAFVSYIYLVSKINKNKKKFNEKIRNVNEPIVTNKAIVRKIIIYAVPFIMIDLFKSLYNYIDMFEVVRGLTNVGFSTGDAESIYSILSTWGNKFNMIILSISSAIVINLIPNLTSNIIKKDFKSANSKVVQALNIILFLAIPITFGISFLSKPIWMLFYGHSVYGYDVLSYYIFVGLFIALATSMVTSLQCYKNYKWIFISLFGGVFLKLLLNINLLVAFNKMGLPPYYGIITATILGYFLTFIICMIVFHVKYKVNYEDTIKNFIDILCGSILMIFVLFLVKLIVPIYSDNRIFNIFIILLYSFIGMVTYFIYVYKSRLIDKLFGNMVSKKINRLLFKK